MLKGWWHASRFSLWPSPMPCRSDDSGKTASIVTAVSQQRDNRHHESENDDEEDEERAKLLSPYLTFDGRQFLRRVGWAGNPQIELMSARGRDGERGGQPPAAVIYLSKQNRATCVAGGRSRKPGVEPSKKPAGGNRECSKASSSILRLESYQAVASIACTPRVLFFRSLEPAAL
jgi:hypothetical protein